MNISEHFTLEEMTRTSSRYDNTPGIIHVINLTRLVCLFLQPLRDITGTLNSSSGFRSAVVNADKGGVDMSFHLDGLAADCWSERFTPYELMAKAHSMGLPYDKMIAEDNGRFKWLHIQLQPPGVENRFERYHANIVNGEMVYKKVN